MASNMANLSLMNKSFLTIRKPLSTCLLVIFLLACQGEDTADVDTSQASEVEAEQSVPAINKKTLRGRVTSHMLLGTGSVQGVYFPVGGVICRLLNRHKSLHRIRCSLESTGGSIQNLRDLRAGDFDLVFAQSDWQYHAYNGSSTFREQGPNKDLRAVLALESDPLALIVKVDSDIADFDDLQDRTVSFGYARSLQHRIINELLSAKGWTDKNFQRVRRMNDSKQVGELCADRVEAILLLSSSLTDYLRDLDESCKLRLVPIEGPEITRIIEQKPYYRVGRIPKGRHLDSKLDTPSFGLGATFVALESTSPKAIYHVVKEIVENFKDFQSLHPSLASLRKKDLPYAGISAPLHPGAIRYYREARLMQ